MTGPRLVFTALWLLIVGFMAWGAVCRALVQVGG